MCRIMLKIFVKQWKENDMKANELMLGDLVQVNGEMFKVISISYFDIGIADSKKGFYHEHIDNIKPIFLSPEILQKNGFKLQRDKSELGILDTYWLGSELGAFRIHRLNNGGYQFGLAKIRNVHELQHSLRLCGIDKEIII